mgnify:CR=1 FL=1
MLQNVCNWVVHAHRGPAKLGAMGMHEVMQGKLKGWRKQTYVFTSAEMRTNWFLIMGCTLPQFGMVLVSGGFVCGVAFRELRCRVEAEGCAHFYRHSFSGVL